MLPHGGRDDRTLEGHRASDLFFLVPKELASLIILILGTPIVRPPLRCDFLTQETQQVAQRFLSAPPVAVLSVHAAMNRDLSEPLH